MDSSTTGETAEALAEAYKFGILTEKESFLFLRLEPAPETA
jgi:hypothetical protein